MWCRLPEKPCFLVERHHCARLPPLPHHWHAAQGIRCEVSFFHGPEEQMAQHFEVTIDRRLGERLVLFEAILSIVTHHGSTNLADGDIREIRQKNLQAIDVVGFRTGFAEESRGQSAECKIRLEPVRKRASESEFLLILFINAESQASVPRLGRFHMPNAIEPDVGPIHIAALIERHFESPPSSVNCLLFENPLRDLRPVEHELPYAPDPEVREPAHEVPLPHGPGGTSEQSSNLVDGEDLAQSICRTLLRDGFCYGQFCPRGVGPNSLELLHICVFFKFDLCHTDRPICSRSQASVPLYKEEPPTVHRGVPFASMPNGLFS